MACCSAAVARVPVSTRELRWRVQEEGGAVHQGSVSAEACAEEGRATLDDGRAMRALRLSIELPLPIGYHRLSLEGDAHDAKGETLLVSAPRHCHRPPALGEAGRTTVEEKFSLTTHAPRFLETLQRTAEVGRWRKRVRQRLETGVALAASARS